MTSQASADQTSTSIVNTDIANTEANATAPGSGASPEGMSINTQSTLAKVQTLLRNLFQFDTADLDFGIYRILNLKHTEIANFVDTSLPRIVDLAFASAANEDRSKLESALAQKKQQIIDDVAEEEKAFDSSGLPRLELFTGRRNTELAQEYTKLKVELDHYTLADTLKDRVYNDLLTFFSRYYQDGDFIAKRRIGRNDAYAIPYNGEEVLLHWANRDQYYIKTDDRFKHYTFDAALGQGALKVNFELQNADVEQNNNKAQEKRYFVLINGVNGGNKQDDAVVWEESARKLAILFEFRSLTQKEKDAIGGAQNPQDKLNAAIEQRILDALPHSIGDDMVLAPIKGALAYKDGEKARTVLGKHLYRYTSRNSADFFIHRNLRAFLVQELDFFIKSEALQLDELMAGSDDTNKPGDSLRALVARARVLREVAQQIIDFLAQVEDFQKRLYEKKKFVVETNYCITLDRVPNEFYKEIAANDVQREEWVRLFSIDDIQENLVNPGYSVPLTEPFLMANPFLVLDTQFFNQNFTNRLLAHFTSLDEQLNGVLVHSENFQALSLLQQRYKGQVPCVYIDPPYNTAASEILYKNEYKHSSWLSLMANRIEKAQTFMSGSSILCVTIDDAELHRLWYVLNLYFAEQLGTIVIRNNPQGRATQTGFRINHEYALFYSGVRSKSVGRLERVEEKIARWNEIDEVGKPFLWENFRKTGTDSRKDERPKQYYPVYANGTSLRLPKMRYADDTRQWEILEEPLPGETVIWPIDDNGTKRVWKWGHERMIAYPNHVKVELVRGGPSQLYNRNYMNEEGALPGTWWDKAEYAAGSHGTNLLTALFGERHQFPFPKSVYAVEACLRIAGGGSLDALCLDFFAGSGTTGHAVINMNRADNGARKYILVEMGDYFSTVTKPRIQKVIYSQEWKDGKPISHKGVSHFFKYLRLESYEDALNNILITPQESGPAKSAVEADNQKAQDMYLMRYMLDIETRQSPSLLNVDAFKCPFDYKLLIEEGDVRHERAVDLVETFNYLLGLRVSSMRQFEDMHNKHSDGSSRLYRVVLGDDGPTGSSILIVWRSADDIESDSAKLRSDASFIEKTILPEIRKGLPVDTHLRLLVNGGGSCIVDGAEEIEPLFKSLMFAPVREG